MEPAIQFLPAFDAQHINKYFSNNKETIKEVFLAGNESLQDDLATISVSFENRDIAGLQQAVHTIRPLFYLLGLMEIQEQLNNFFVLCMSVSSVDEVSKAYTALWPILQSAQLLIYEQCQLFH